jgi:hypothetical protein
VSRISVVIMSGPDDGKSFEVVDSKVRLGNSSDCQIRIRHDPRIPKDGLEASFGDESIVLNDRASGEELIFKYGDIQEVGTTSIAAYKPE